MSLTQQISKTRSIYLESVFAIIVGLMVTASVTITDIEFHDNYVKRIIEWCHPENQDDFCQWFREGNGNSVTDHMELGDNYWDRLAGQMVEIFFILFVFRLVIAVMLKLGHVRSIRPTSIIMAFTWGLSGSVLFGFGVLDTLYYWFQGLPIPETLGWLNNAGVFTETRTWFGDPEIVDKLDLYVTNIVGFLILIGITLFNMAVFVSKGYKTRNTIA